VCGADSLLVPITFQCAVCQPLDKAKATMLCRDCFTRHSKTNIHEGVAIRGRGRARAYRRKYSRRKEG
jgi:hypothetical protein